MSILKKIFGIKAKEPVVDKTDVNSEKSELSGLEKFKSKNSDNRIKDIMILGDTGNPKAFEILEYAVLSDNDKGVVMAALKRLPNFKNDERLFPLLEKLKDKANIKEYEPYYSMTLLNLGLIDKNEFNKIFEE
jgi:hypothetical protein